MKDKNKRIAQATIAAALLETAAAAVRSHSYYPFPAVMNAIIEIAYFLIFVGVAAFITSRVARSASWIQRIVFFGIVFTPSLLSYIDFFRTVTYYEQFGTDLVVNNQMMDAGYREIVSNGVVSAGIALIATFIYFRKSSGNKQQVNDA